ncbi:MAG: UDP-N-acetylmuramoyl-L-alanyl-D-glutamate--2,6-diaminopimelate ligase [Polyangiales bacterium]
MSAEIEARFAAAHPLLRTIATTGTNGKTTTTSMIASIVEASGEPWARLTTLGATVHGEPIDERSPMREFLATVERSVQLGVRTLALEVTSKALLDGFARQWPPSIAVFTNLTRDHLDLHKTPEAYLAAKAQLFMALGATGVAVLNDDDPSSALLREVIAPSVTVLGYSVDPARTDARLAARRIAVTPGKTLIDLADSPLAARLAGRLALSVTGAVHAQNALAAALATDAAGYSAEAIARGLESFTGVAGRFEIVHRAPLVVVDYAHTPDGLSRTLETARALCERRLLCVFGCGGDRDLGKRGEMGSIADALADVVVLTSDNPRSEEPARIAAMVREGAPSPRAQWLLELDRAAAIERAISLAHDPRDVVVIAGKGHERTQEIAGVVRPFSDVAVARAAIAQRSTSA